MLNNARATLQQQLIAFAGCGTMKVLIACLELVEHVLAYNSTQFHVLDALAEEAEQLLTANPPYTAGNHGFDGSKRKMTICINQE